MSLVYSPEDDSYLLSETLKNYLKKALKKNPEIKFLEVGVGSGIQLNTALDCGIKKTNIFGVDINSDAVRECKKMGFKCNESDLFSKVDGKFDLIVFNPPYLPEDEIEPEDSKLITTGGKTGSELINKFLVQAKKHLTKEGKILLLVSSLTNGISWAGCKKNLLSRKKIFFEELKVYECQITKKI